MDVRSIFLIFLIFSLAACKPALRQEFVDEPILPLNPEVVPESLDLPVKVSQFPMRRTLHNPQGKAIEGEVLAKDGERIAFLRDADGERFVISIFQLSVDDQLFLGNLEDEGLEIIQSVSQDGESAGK